MSDLTHSHTLKMFNLISLPVLLVVALLVSGFKLEP